MRPELRYGLGAGLAWILWIAIEFALGFHTTHLRAGEIASWMTEVIQFGVLVLLLRSAHRLMPLGRLEPWDAVLKSLVTSAVFAVVIYAGTILCVDFIDPSWLTRMLTWKVTEMRGAGVSEETIRAFIVSTRQEYSALGLARLCFVLTPLIGAVMGMVICIFLNWRWEKVNLVSP